MIDSKIVLDTAGPVLYLGVLKEIAAGGFWLEDVDVHDCRDGHATKEVYLIEAVQNGITPNRKRAYVMASAVISTSLLEDVLPGSRRSASSSMM